MGKEPWGFSGSGTESSQVVFRAMTIRSTTE